MEYFRLLFDDSGKNNTNGVAIAPEEIDLFLLETGMEIDRWHTIKMKLEDGNYSHYLGNDMNWKLCSTNLKKIIWNNINEKDKRLIQWLDVYVESEKYGNKYYHVLHFKNEIEAIDISKSAFVENTDIIIKPYLNLKCIEGYKLFTYRGGNGIIVINSELKETLISCNMVSGIEFSKILIG